MKRFHHSNSRVFTLLLAGIGLALSLKVLWGQPSANWRVFRASDGLRDSLCSAVTVSPRGNVWVKHIDANAISVFDGYLIDTLPSPGNNTFRVHENRSGQLWSLYSEGLVVYENKEWIKHPIPEIRAEIQANPLRQIRQIPLYPAERDRIFFLLSDRLLTYDAASRRTALIRHVSQTGLGSFTEMTEAHDGGAWISGTHGFAKVPGPIRHLTSATVWQEAIVDRSLGIKNFQRPFENPPGTIVAAAFKSDGGNERAIVQFDGKDWQVWSVGDELIREAWRAWDGNVWAFSVNSLFQIRDETLIRSPLWPGQFKDVTVETNGVFWLANSEGLLRYGPFLWRTPKDAPVSNSAIHAALAEADGTIWFAGTDSLVRYSTNKWEMMSWPEDFEAEFRPTDALFKLPDARIALAGAKPLIYNSDLERFEYLEHPTGAPIRILGQLENRSLCVQVLPSALGHTNRLEAYDGSTFSSLLDLPEAWSQAELVFASPASDGRLWVGGTQGLAVYERESAQLRIFSAADGFTLGRPSCFLELGDGRVWCGGGDRILEFNGRTWKVVADGLERVNGMTKGRDGRIWVAGISGLHSYWNSTWLANGLDDGLPSAAIYEVFVDGRGQIWAGTAQGLSRYHPDADPDPPRVFEPRVGNSKDMADATPLTVVFRGRDKWAQTAAERLLFAYRLDKREWSPYIDAERITLERLGAGSHQIEVRALDRNWNESTDPISVEFAIVVPWYQEPRIIIISALALFIASALAALAINRHRQLVRSYAEVERIVAQRTRELERANRELVHSQKMRALGTFAAGIAHDFNNILSIVKGSAQIIEKNIDDKEKIRTRVGRIKTVVDQGSAIVKSILGLTREQQHPLEPWDVNVAVEQTMRLLSDRVPPSVSVSMDLPPFLPALSVPKELIQQILVNLVLNAVEAFSSAGAIEVSTGVSKKLPSHLALAPLQAQNYVLIAVKDNGCGIPPEVQPRIFEPFFTTKARSAHRGTGLGLSMVYELAKETGCGLAVDSTTGKGSRFTIIVPVGE